MTLDVKYYELKGEISLVAQAIAKKAKVYENPSVCIFNRDALEAEIAALESILKTLKTCEANLPKGGSK